MMPLGHERISAVWTAFLLSTLAACGGSSSDVAPDESGESGGGMVTGGAGNAAGGMAGPAGGAGSSGGGTAGHVDPVGAGGAGGAGGSAIVDAGSGGKSGSMPISDATIAVQPDGPWKVAPLPAVGSPGIMYLSDLQPTKVELFDKFGGAARTGPMHNDESFTGKPLVINGVYYAKGIGVHTYARITYSLAGGYTKFVSDTGLDFLESSSTMIFEVEVDGKLVYDNGNGTKTKDQLAPVSLDVTGKTSILLYVRDGFDDSAGDFGVWGGARLVK
jgi:NPCBM/NEW2 domain